MRYLGNLAPTLLFAGICFINIYICKRIYKKRLANYIHSWGQFANVLTIDKIHKYAELGDLTMGYEHMIETTTIGDLPKRTFILYEEFTVDDLDDEERELYETGMLKER